MIKPQTRYIIDVGSTIATKVATPPMGRISLVEQHPRRSEIIDALLAGRSCRSVSAKFSVSYMAVARYRKNVIRPAILAQSRQSPTPVGVSPESLALIARRQGGAQAEIASAPILARAEILRQRRERMLDKSEKTGDLRGFASIDRNSLVDLELEARLTGVLEQPAGVVQVSVSFGGPAAADPPPVLPPEDVEFVEDPE